MFKRLLSVAVALVLFAVLFPVFLNAAYAAEEALLAAAVEEAGNAREEAAPAGIDFRQKLNAIVTDMKRERQEQSAMAVEAYTRYMPSSGAHDMSGDVGVVDSAAEYSYAFKAFDKLPVQFGLKTKYIGVDNSTGVKLPAKMTGLTIGVETTFPFFKLDKTYVRVGAYPSFFGENWSMEASTFRLPSRFFLIHEANDKLILIAGVAVYPRFRQSVWPIAGFLYKPNDRLSFSITPERPNVSYKLSERLTVFAVADASYGEYEVKKDGRDNAILQYKEYSLGTGLTYKLNNSVDITLDGGAAFNRYFKYRDSLGKVNVKNGGYVELRTEIKL